MKKVKLFISIFIIIPLVFVLDSPFTYFTKSRIVPTLKTSTKSNCLVADLSSYGFLINLAVLLVESVVCLAISCNEHKNYQLTYAGDDYPHTQKKKKVRHFKFHTFRTPGETPPKMQKATNQV